MLPHMKLITTIVRPERLAEVKAALFRAGVTGITLSRVSGHGGEREVLSEYRGTTVVMEFHEKVKIEKVIRIRSGERDVEALTAVNADEVQQAALSDAREGAL